MNWRALKWPTVDEEKEVLVGTAADGPRVREANVDACSVCDEAAGPSLAAFRVVALERLKIMTRSTLRPTPRARARALPQPSSLSLSPSLSLRLLFDSGFDCGLSHSH